MAMPAVPGQGWLGIDGGTWTDTQHGFTLTNAIESTYRGCTATKNGRVVATITWDTNNNVTIESSAGRTTQAVPGPCTADYNNLLAAPLGLIIALATGISIIGILLIAAANFALLGAWDQAQNDNCFIKPQ